MYVQSITGLNYFNYPLSRNKQSFISLKPLQCDTFIKSKEISFEGTSAGNPLRKLPGIKCPYLGVLMLNGIEIARIDKELLNCHTVKKTVYSLKKYQKNMQETESKVFDMFKDAAKISNRIDFSDLLKQWYDDALIRLKLEEFEVLDKIDQLSTKLSPVTAFAVREKVTDCRKLILDNNPTKPFKRKNILASIDSIIPQAGEEKLLEELKDMAYLLPMSGTSVNAFIVKYANRTHSEISRRLVLPSFATIEHIKPSSFGGENSLNNFLLVSSAANSLRQNMPLSKFTDKYPQVITNCQNYIEQIIGLINKNKLRGLETYPYEVRKTLLKESMGKIDLDLTTYKYTEREARAAEAKNRKTRKKRT